jgi:type IV pilus assembly protein PilA
MFEVGWRETKGRLMNIGSAALRRRDRQEGFTLIELMVVLLIIAILIAILMPTFIGSRKRAQDRAVQSTLRNGLTGAKVIYTDKQDYTSASTASLSAVEPSLSFVDSSTAPTDPSSVSVFPASATYIVLAGLSKSGTCFYMADDITLGTLYARDPSPTSCTAGSAPAQGDTAWMSSW